VVPDDAWDLVRRAAASGANLHVGHTFPFHPAVIAARRAILDGMVGELVLASGLFSTAVAGLYRGDTEFARAHTDAPLAPLPTTYADPRSGGHLYSQLSHAVAVLLYLTGEQPAAVSAIANRLETGVDRADALAVRFESGLAVSIAGAGTVHDHDQRTEEYRIFGTDGHVALDTAAETLLTTTSGAAATAATLPGGDLSLLPARRLIDTRLGLAPVQVDGALGALTVDVLAAARRSAEAGGSQERIERRNLEGSESGS
jgi:predicted dehydrogenase